MLNVSTNSASVNTALTVQHLTREIRAFERMADRGEREENNQLLDASYCLDAPSLLPTGCTGHVVATWGQR